MKLDSVTAKFGGRELTFKIAKDDLAAFEAYAGKSAYAIFKSVAESCWLVGDVKTVLRFATMHEKSLAQFRLAARVGHSSPFHYVGKTDHVDNTLAGNPVAQYAGLAMNILAGALFGIDPADAVFNDGVPVGEG